MFFAQFLAKKFKLKILLRKKTKHFEFLVTTTVKAKSSAVIGGGIMRGRPKPDVSPPPQASHDQN